MYYLTESMRFYDAQNFRSALGLRHLKGGAKGDVAEIGCFV